ncbi:MAG: ROK family protein [Verrucomicrobia bacterium]|nr:ROK family protein [Verrucomicrobiota bacterium]
MSFLPLGHTGFNTFDMDGAIGIDLGGSSVKIVVITGAGETLEKLNVPFDDSTHMNWADKIRESHSHLKSKFELGACSTGVSAPGLASNDGRSIAYMPGRLSGLEGLNWSEFLHLSTPVPVLNDAHAALLGEAWIGAAKGFQNVILLTLGTGVGGAAMVDGKLLRGRIGRAGHLGHVSLDPEGPPDVCGTPGSLEVAIGNCTIQQRTNGRFQSTHELIRAHEAGDSEASVVWLKSVKALASAICSFINILDPEAVIVGGGIARAGETLFAPLEKFLDPIEWRPGGHRAKILSAQLGEFAGAIGAARNALNV